MAKDKIQGKRQVIPSYGVFAFKGFRVLEFQILTKFDLKTCFTVVCNWKYKNFSFEDLSIEVQLNISCRLKIFIHTVYK